MHRLPIFCVVVALFAIINGVTSWPFVPILCASHDNSKDCLEFCDCMWWSSNETVTSLTFSSETQGKCTDIEKQYLNSNNSVYKNGEALTSYFDRQCRKNREAARQSFIIFLWIFVTAFIFIVLLCLFALFNRCLREKCDLEIIDFCRIVMCVLPLQAIQWCVGCCGKCTSRNYEEIGATKIYEKL